MSLINTFKKALKSAKTKIIGVAVIAILASGLALSSIKLASADGVNNNVSAETASNVSSCNPDSDPTNSVLYCGAGSIAQLQDYYNNGDVSASGDSDDTSSSIQNIYSADPFDISSSDIANMSTDSQSGYVTKSGDVYLSDGTLVATNALTAGRAYVSGSTEVIHNGTTLYERPTSAVFIENQLSAFIVMENGVFKFAILNACGNPIHATPKLPNYTILKQVKTSSGSYATNITAPAGSTVDYKITVTSNGAVPAVNVLIKDDLQSAIVYKTGTLEQNGSSVGPGVTNAFFNGGITLPTVKNGTSITFTFEAVVEPSVTTQTCKTGEIPNMATISSVELPTELSRAYVEVECPSPTPSLTCVDLDLGQPSAANGQGNIPYTLSVTATANDAKITDYVFSFTNTSGGSSISPKTVTTSADSATLTQDFVPGQYNVTVTVEGTEGNSTTKITNTSANCAKELTASTTPVCTAPNGSTYPAGSAECNATTTTTTTLANTGPGNDVLLFLLSSVGGSGVYLLVVKKHLISKILK